MLINEILFERSRAYLYHSTSLFNAYHILRTDILKPSIGIEKYGSFRAPKEIKDVVYFTRNPNYNKTSYEDEDALSVKFVIDQDRLKYDYKVIPIFTFYGGNRTEKIPEFDESEEVIKGSLKNLNKYINNIIIPTLYPYENQFEYHVNESLFAIDYEFNFNVLDKNFNSYYHGKELAEITEYYNDLVMLNYIMSHPKFDNDDTLNEIYNNYEYIFKQMAGWI